MTSSYIQGLNGFRALCALFILWGHISQRDFCQWEISMLPLPECCAYVFFVISGFLAGYRIDKTKGWWPYYKKKVRRIFPLYFFYLFVTVVIYLASGQAKQVLQPRLLYYLFLLPQIPFCCHDGILPLVHLWFIGTIVLFYFIFPLFAKLREDTRKVGAVVISIAWLFLKLSVWVFVGADSFLYRIISVTCFDVLFAGVWAGLLMKERDSLLDKVRRLSWIGVIAWLLFLCSGYYGRLIPAPVRIEYIALLSLLIIITQQAESPVPSLECGFLNWLGTFSYEIYISHIVVIILISSAYARMEMELPSIVLYLVCTMVVIGVALCFRVVCSQTVDIFK